MEQGQVRITRSSDSDLKIRTIEVLIDDQHVGNLLYGETLEVPIPAGPHRLKATNRLKSASVDFSVGAGETAEFRATGVMMGGFWMLVSLLGTVAYRIRLEKVA